MTGCWAPKAHRCARATKAIPTGPNRQKVYCGTSQKILMVVTGGMCQKSTVHRTLLHMGLRSRRPVRMPMMTPVHVQKHLQWTREHRNWTLEQWRKVAWSDESRFLLDHVDGRVRVRRLPGEVMATGCTVGRRQASRGSVMFCAGKPWVRPFLWTSI